MRATKSREAFSRRSQFSAPAIVPTEARRRLTDIAPSITKRPRPKNYVVPQRRSVQVSKVAFGGALRR